ncbi:MAG: hypothetical protein GY724_13990 [Actinomycetia bacterium]|nr:hypothetical protein [Actinomycetes bacterium]MCP4225288.1 hypothetical protein [Actinomycetes bacterium]MCP5033442.1 hypothetical protein [Actinomycetes bacterium]
MKAVGVVILALLAFFVVKSIVSMLVSLVLTVVVVGAAIALISFAMSAKTNN